VAGPRLLAHKPRNRPFNIRHYVFSEASMNDQSRGSRAQNLVMAATPQPVHVTAFYADGRGPELVKVHWGAGGRQLLAIDYHNPDDRYDSDNLRYVSFVRPQVVMITPEEVIRYGGLVDLLVQHRPAAMFDLGADEWLESFSPRHLGSCRHYQLLFYDELFDVICEGVECRQREHVATRG
jgi:hypothetical protein